MRSATPKVLHSLAGRSLLGHALAAARGLDPQRLAVVVRHERDAVAAHALEIAPEAVIADQDEVKGTGRAVRCALDALDVDAAAGGSRLDGPVVVLAGDVPLLDSATLAELLAAHSRDANAVTVLTTRVPDPTGYGRILREEGTGEVLAIVEERDASPAQRQIDEINSSVYVFDADTLRRALIALESGEARANAQGEVYLTDVLELARRAGGAVRAIATDDPVAVEGVNDRAQLAALATELNRRVLTEWMIQGVTVMDPGTTWVDVDVELAQDVTLEPGVQLRAGSVVEAGASIGPDSTLIATRVGAEAHVVRTHAIDSEIGPGANVGPFAYLRPGTRLGADGKIGTFVETKNATIGTGSKVPHLSYVGDAEIGEGSNIGAATIFVNYDGVTKHHTSVGDQVRTGSDNTFVAPVTIGDGAYTGAGAVIRRDVPPGALAVSVAPQRNVEGWVRRRRPGTAAAEAAERATRQTDAVEPQQPDSAASPAPEAGSASGDDGATGRSET